MCLFAHSYLILTYFITFYAIVFVLCFMLLYSTLKNLVFV